MALSPFLRRTIMIDLQEMGQRAREAAAIMAQTSTKQKNVVLVTLAHLLHEKTEMVLAANALDMERGLQRGLPLLSLDRLRLTPHIINMAAESVERLAPDPVGEVFEQQIQSNGLCTAKRRVSLSVLGIIYEARSTVTIDAAMLCVKSGNATILRGGNETQYSNEAIMSLIRAALVATDLPEDAVQMIADPARALVKQLLQLDQYVDVIIPRGGVSLQKICREHARVPLILSGAGVCHLYVDQSVELEKVIPVIRNAKVQLPNGCNTIETLLVHHAIASQALPKIAADLLTYDVELRVDCAALEILSAHGLDDKRIIPAHERDFGTEFLALILSIRLVDSVDEAIEHIAHYGTGHSDGILTVDPEAAETFINRVDSSAVFVNTSTRFNDAGSWGLGTEVAISNQKLHARGPIAL
jgi:glutamate-5-semialdehyde dehydrogenase